MNDNHCEVQQFLDYLLQALQNGAADHPAVRYSVERAVDLSRRIADGRASPDDFKRLETLAHEIADDPRATKAQELGRNMLRSLDRYREVFVSHIDTRNCPSGACSRLTPAPCQMACPAGIDVPAYVALIGEGRYGEAIEVIRKDNPFPWVCGLVCTRPCEPACVRGQVDSPIAIKALKGFAARQALANGFDRNPVPATDNGRQVCVVGAGPGGLTAAYYLALQGYRVSVLEAGSRAGGMLLFGIPRYRLPATVIEREVALIESLGVDIRYNTRLGRDITFAQLQREGFDAFYLAPGAHRSFTLNIPGETDCAGIIQAVDFLRESGLDRPRKPGRRVVIIGGGNVAIDAARTCVRLGCREVTIAYRRTRAEMPADVEEIEQAIEEGVQLSFLTVPVGIESDDGRVTGLKCLQAKLVAPTDGGRMKPVPIDGSEYLLEADAVIPAIGQRVGFEDFQAVEGLTWSPRNTIGVNEVSMATSVAGVFAAGDAVTGPATVVEAIGGGKRAARAIDRYLHGLTQPQLAPVPARRARVAPRSSSAEAQMSLQRPPMPHLEMEARLSGFEQVEIGFDETAARQEAQRCLRCDICGRCGDCVQVCREEMGIEALHLGYTDASTTENTDFGATTEKCITCGACAVACPTGAMQIRDRNGERILTLCGTELNRQELVHCRSCGAVLGSAQYLDFVDRRIQALAPAPHTTGLCSACQRAKTAAAMPLAHSI